MCPGILGTLSCLFRIYIEAIYSALALTPLVHAGCEYCKVGHDALQDHKGITYKVPGIRHRQNPSQTLIRFVLVFFAKKYRYQVSFSQRNFDPHFFTLVPHPLAVPGYLGRTSVCTVDHAHQGRGDESSSVR